MDRKKGADNLRLLIELENIQSRGITIWLNGIESSPLTVMDAISINENQSFMRDYVTDERGVLTQLRFDQIKDL